MDARAQERLQAFADATADKAHVSADDVERFCALCIELHRAKVAVTSFEIREELQRCGFDSDTALRFALQFEHYRGLLEQFDPPSP